MIIHKTQLADCCKTHVPSKILPTKDCGFTTSPENTSRTKVPDTAPKTAA